MNIGDNSFDINERGREAVKELANKLYDLDEHSKYINITWNGKDYIVSSLQEKKGASSLQNLIPYFERIILDESGIGVEKKEKILRLYTAISNEDSNNQVKSSEDSNNQVKSSKNTFWSKLSTLLSRIFGSNDQKKTDNKPEKNLIEIFTKKINEQKKSNDSTVVLQSKKKEEINQTSLGDPLGLSENVPDYEKKTKVVTTNPPEVSLYVSDVFFLDPETQQITTRELYEQKQVEEEEIAAKRVLYTALNTYGLELKTYSKNEPLELIEKKFESIVKAPTDLKEAYKRYEKVSDKLDISWKKKIKLYDEMRKKESEAEELTEAEGSKTPHSLDDLSSNVNKNEELVKLHQRFESAKSLNDSYEQGYAMASVLQELTRKEYFAEALELGKTLDDPDRAYKWIINALPTDAKGFDTYIEITKMTEEADQRDVAYFSLIQSSIGAGCLEQTNKAIKEVSNKFQTIFAVSEEFKWLLDNHEIDKVLDAVKKIKDNNIGTYSLGDALVNRLENNEEWLEIAKKCIGKLTQSEINEMISYGLLILLLKGKSDQALNFAEKLSTIQNKNFFNENFIEQIKQITVPLGPSIADAIEQAPDKNDELRSILEKIRNLI